jgi:hypothetical protein
VKVANAPTGNAPDLADVILQVCTCSADFLARVTASDEVIAAGNGTPPPSLVAKRAQAFEYCRPAKRPPRTGALVRGPAVVAVLGEPGKSP